MNISSNDMSVNNIDGNISQVRAESNWLQNRKADNSGKKEKSVLPAEEEHAVKISISQEGMKSYRKKLHESGRNESGKVVVKADKDSMIRRAKQAANALGANHYGNELAKETEALKEQRKSGGTYSLSNKAEDYVRAYGNLYDEIVQGCQNGTRERYVEDDASETGYRKMTMEEELNELDKAFQRAADGADVKEMITSEFQRLSSKAGRRQTSFEDTGKKPQTTEKEETIGDKMKRLAQAWKDAYRTSGSKEDGMEKVLSMLDEGLVFIKGDVRGKCI